MKRRSRRSTVARRVAPALVPLLILGAAPGCLNEPADDIETDEHVEATSAALLRSLSLPVAADSSVRRWVPNLGHGSDVRLHVGRNVTNWDRSVLRFDRQALLTLVNGGVLKSAKLRLTIEAMDPLFRNDTPLQVRALTRAWVESGVTWHCPNDPTPTDTNADCVGPSWDMLGTSAPPWTATPVGASVLKRGQTGVVDVDVTAEVQRWLSGNAESPGLILGLGGDPIDAWVNFVSREGGAGPTLLLEVDDPYQSCTPGAVDALVSDVDTYVDQAAAKAAFGTQTTLKAGPAPGAQVAIVGFSKAQLATLARLKDHPMIKVELVLPVTQAATGTHTVQAHRVKGTLVEASATWECRNDTNTSASATTCAAADTWTFTPPASAYQATPSASAQGPLKAGGEVRLDVTADLVAGGDATVLAWAVTDSAKASFGSGESSTKPKLVITSGPRCTLTPPGRVKVILGGLPEKERAAVSLVTFATHATACRVAKGQVVTELEKGMLAQLKADNPTAQGLADVLAYLGARCDEASMVTPADRKALLGPLAAADPLKLPLAPFDVHTFADAAFASKVLVPPRLRENQCVGGGTSDTRAVTVGVSVMPEYAPDDFDNEYGSTAAPVVVGIAPRHEDPRKPTSPLVGHPALINDYLTDRSDGTAEMDGDGLDPNGITTNLTCSATKPCPGGMGLRCDGFNCRAYPIVQEGESINLLGYNFWDTQDAKLVWERVDSSWTHTSAISGFKNRESESAQACKPGTGYLPFQRLWTKKASTRNESHAVATFPVEVEAGHFYRLRMYNKNGNYHTVHTDDPASGLNPGRTLHVCWKACLDDPNRDPASCPRPCNGPNDTQCAVTTCKGNPTQTCAADGLGSAGACAASQWTAAPRPLSKCLSGLPYPSDQHKCAETPEWFGSVAPYGIGPIVYVEKRRPTFKIGVRLDRVEAAEESGGDFWGDDEFEHVLVASVIGPDGKTKTHELSYSNDFQDGQKRHPEKGITFPASSTSLVVWTVHLIENDDGIGKFLKALKGLNHAVHIIAGAVVGGYYGGYAGATAGAAVGEGIALAEAEAIDALFGDYARGDNLGTGAWYGTAVDYVGRIGDTRRDDFLTGGWDVTVGPMPTPGDFDTHGKQEHRLGHPMRLDPPEDCECGTGCAEQSCASDEACYANLCVEDFQSCTVSDPNCQKGFREVRRFDTRKNSAEAEYQLDYLNTIELCNPVVEKCL
jgi:hypothetical protein